MESIFPGQVAVAQVGSYFVGQYYQILQQHPSLVHQFYTDGSKMLLIDGDSTETATSMLQIHSLIMTLNFTGIEIKTIHSLDSWDGGILVMVSGFVRTKDYNAGRKFVQTFFLAPQEKGYFVLNDIFHLLDEEEKHQHPAVILANSDYESNLNAPNTIPEPEEDMELAVSDYVFEEDLQAGDYAAPVHTEENDTVDKFSIPEPPQQISESDDRVDETPAEEPIASFPGAMNMARDPPPAPAPAPAPVEEPVVELPKQTYASILRLAKGQSVISISQAASSSKTISVASDWNQAPQSVPQQYYPPLSSGPEKSSSEAVKEISAFEDEGEEKSVYVRNLPSSITASDLEHEFKNFGRIKPDGVAVRSRKDSGGYYAFVEFEDVIGVQNALKASPMQLSGRQIYVEERRPSSSIPRGGRRGRGRGGYQSEAPRGRFVGRSFGRGSSGQDYDNDNDREYNGRMRANGGAHQRVPRQERGILGNHAMRNGQNPSEEAS